MSKFKPRLKKRNIVNALTNEKNKANKFIIKYFA